MNVVLCVALPLHSALASFRATVHISPLYSSLVGFHHPGLRLLQCKLAQKHAYPADGHMNDSRKHITWKGHSKSFKVSFNWKKGVSVTNAIITSQECVYPPPPLSSPRIDKGKCCLVSYLSHHYCPHALRMSFTSARESS